MFDVIVIAAANGASVDLNRAVLLRDTFGILEYVNVDTIALSLSAFAFYSATFEAEKSLLEWLASPAAELQDFAFETTLASFFT
jgi:predicted ABC-type ATPase